MFLLALPMNIFGLLRIPCIARRQEVIHGIGADIAALPVPLLLLLAFQIKGKAVFQLQIIAGQQTQALLIAMVPVLPLPPPMLPGLGALASLALTPAAAQARARMCATLRAQAVRVLRARQRIPQTTAMPALLLPMHAGRQTREQSNVTAPVLQLLRLRLLARVPLPPLPPPPHATLLPMAPAVPQKTLAPRVPREQCAEPSSITSLRYLQDRHATRSGQ